MNEHPPQIDIEQLAGWRLKSTGRLTSVLWTLVIGGIVAATINSQFVEEPGQRLMRAWLVAFAFVLSISLGMMFFVVVTHLTRAGWPVVVRRFAEIFCLNLIVVGLMFIPIAWSVWQGDGLVYPWSRRDAGAEHRSVARLTSPNEIAQPTRLSNDAPTAPRMTNVAWRSSDMVGRVEGAVEESHEQGHHQVDKSWLRSKRFLITWAVLFAIWIGLGTFYYRNSVAQDRSGDPRLTMRMEGFAGPAAILFAFSLTCGAFDLLMSLQPDWYSTMFGVYYFAGCAVGGIAALLLIVLLLRASGLVPDAFSEEVQRDLGRLQFAFVFFWGYIAFSQYMLLWYANMPETTSWLVRRGMSTADGYQNSWGWLAIVLLLGHLLIPFAGIMSRHVKSNSRAMIFWTSWLLIMHYLDLYWIVIPTSQPTLAISFVELGTAAALISIYLLSAIWIARRTNLFAVGDPRMPDSLSGHALY